MPSLAGLLFIVAASGSGLTGRWPIPSSPGAVLQNLDRLPTAAQASHEIGPPPAPVRSQLDITITVRSRVDVTLICRTRGELFNHDLPGAPRDPEPAPGQCAQMIGEKASERIEDTSRRKRGKP